MKKQLFKILTFYPVYLILFIAYLTLIIFSGFLLHISINHWTLLISFITYNIFLLTYFILKCKASLFQIVSSIFITILLFLSFSSLFAHTYDLSYDGQQYQQTAVIALSHNWNPIYQTKLPIHGEGKFSQSIILGSPKIIWSIDASIYKLTNNINSATSLNIIIMFLAFILCFLALRSLRLDSIPSLILSFLATTTQLFMEQIFSFRQDALSYELLLVGIASLIIALKQKNKLPYFLIIISTLIFLAGSKFTNLFIFIPLTILIFIFAYKYKWYELKIFWLSGIILFLSSLIALANPYITNMIHYHAIDYPYNQTTMIKYSTAEDTTANIKNDNRFELLFYGIFSWSNLGNAQSVANNAQLKVPFALSPTEMLNIGNPTAKLVGGYGVFFSGLFILSLLIYLYLFFQKKDNQDQIIFNWLSLCIGLMFFSVLIDPVPNYARFNGQLELLPVVISVALIIKQKHKKIMIEYMATVLLIVIMTTNLILTFSSTWAFNETAFKNLDSQLSFLKNSHQSYQVYANTFFSNYTLLQQSGVNIQISSKPLKCNKVITLMYTNNGTTLCKI